MTLRSNPPRDLPASSKSPVRTPEPKERLVPQPLECGSGVRWEIVRRGLRTQRAAALPR